MARRKRGRRGYATDLTDGQWALIAPLIPEAEPGGRPRKASARTLVDAILYFLRAGMAWGGFEREVQRSQANLILTSFPRSASIAWNGVL
jgi:transposase